MRALARAKPHPGRLLRFTSAVAAARRLPCASRSRGLSPNSLRSLRSLRSDKRRQVSCGCALRARPHALRCSAPPRRCAACPGAPLLQRPWCSGEELHRCLSGRRYSAGAISVATSSAGPGSARASALRCLTRRGCLNAANAVSAVSSAARPRTEQRSAVAAKRRPPQHEPPAGTACRDARTSQASGCSRMAATGRKQRFMRRWSA